MSQSLNIALAQINTTVGAIVKNTEKIIASIHEASDEGADIIVFPELTITGYPPEDLLFRRSLFVQVESALEQIKRAEPNMTVVVGHPTFVRDAQDTFGSIMCYNSASVCQGGEVVTTYHKQRLPNYRVFDERRYFLPGKDACVIEVKGVQVGITICEDLWHRKPASKAKEAGAQVLLNLNASPFYLEKPSVREDIIESRAQETQLPIVYVNAVGGQDELIFDGLSLVSDPEGEVVTSLPAYEEALSFITMEWQNNAIQLTNLPPAQSVKLSEEEMLYKALVLGVRDYAHKNHIPKAVIGLSGGIDSALTLAIAVDALGAENVLAIMMPSRYTSAVSLAEAKKLAANLNVRYEVLSIEPVYEGFLKILAPLMAGTTSGIAEQNIQARCRGVMLMAYSNKFGALVLTTGNKSELAVGYCTLYGDMAGGYCVLKDVSKHWVYRLSRFCNRHGDVIPEAIITRAPSAELAENQLDEDSLPPYHELDDILKHYIEDNWDTNTIVKAGYSHETVSHVIDMVKRNEHKRFQSPPGPRVTKRAFGKDWRYPLTSGFHE